VALTSSLGVLSREAAECDSATIVPSLTCPVGTTAAAGELDSGTAGSGFDFGSDTHGLSASFDEFRHALPFSRFVIPGVMVFETVTSRASTVFTGGTSGSAVGTAVPTTSVCTGVNASTLRGSEILIRHNERKATRARDQSDTY
jgi:hypothetical protein